MGGGGGGGGWRWLGGWGINEEPEQCTFGDHSGAYGKSVRHIRWGASQTTLSRTLLCPSEGGVNPYDR